MDSIYARFSPKWILFLSVLFFAFAVFHVYVKSQQRSTTVLPPAAIEDQGEKSGVMYRETGETESDFKANDRDEGVLAGQETDTSWIAAAEKALNHPDVSRRVQTVLNLRNHPSVEAVHLLANFLNDNAGVVVSEAIDTLGFIALNSNTANLAYEILEEKAKAKGFGFRGQALVTAAMIGKDKILPVVSDFMSEESDAAKASAVRALSLISSPACVPHLAVLLDGSKNSEIRRNSFNVLAKINTPEALNILEEHLNSVNDRDQAASARALSMLDSPNANGMLSDAILKNELQDDALKAVATSPAAPSVFGDLLTRTDVSKAQRASWLETLAEHSSSYGSKERRTALKEAVESLLNSPDLTIQKEAIRAVAGIGAEDTAETLMPYLESKDPAIRKQTVSSLVGYVTPDNYKMLIDLMWDDDQETRRVAFMCVQQFLGHEDREALEKARKHPDELISKQASMLLDQVLR